MKESNVKKIGLSTGVSIGFVVVLLTGIIPLIPLTCFYLGVLVGINFDLFADLPVKYFVQPLLGKMFRKSSKKF